MSDLATSDAKKTDGRSQRPIRVRSCTICRHPERARLEASRVSGTSLRALELQFNVSRDSVHRHVRDHVSEARRSELLIGPARVSELITAAADESKSLLDYLQITRSVLFNAFVNAAEAGDRNGVANLSGRLLDSLRELAKLTGELRESAGVIINNNHLSIVASPQFLQLQQGLLQISRRHPEAKGDVIALLRGLDDQRAVGKPDAAPMIDAEAIEDA
jgi:hypothetical protein